MSLNHSPETHQNLLERIPRTTGKELREWLDAIDEGPTFLRLEEQANWLRDEHGLHHGYAAALAHEHHRRRRCTRTA
ncbi:MAG: DUF4287 domain-containing protein [Streptosporangiales bacterium]|nr:DUF4287 domain-containing protein [Streptosporangiales bacterium]